MLEISDISLYVYFISKISCRLWLHLFVGSEINASVNYRTFRSSDELCLAIFSDDKNDRVLSISRIKLE